MQTADRTDQADCAYYTAHEGMCSRAFAFLFDSSKPRDPKRSCLSLCFVRLRKISSSIISKGLAKTYCHHYHCSLDLSFFNEEYV